MGFGKFLLGSIGVVGAIVAAPVVLPAVATIAATGVATAAAGATAIGSGAAGVASAIGGTAAAIGTGAATAVGSAAISAGGTALGAVGTAVGGAAGAVGLSSIATAAGTTAGATAIGATTVGATIGGANAISGASKMKEAKELSEEAQKIQKENKKRINNNISSTNKSLDNFANTEIEIFSNFEKFSKLFEKIKNRPQFNELSTKKFDLPTISLEDIKDVLFTIEELRNLSASAASGTIGAIVTAGITTSAVNSFAVASTGTAISSLHGVAATNATFAALGGGALNAGGGGIALGQTVLGATTAGVGILIGGIIFNSTASHSKENAQKIFDTAIDNEIKTDRICDFLSDLRYATSKFKKSIEKVGRLYVSHLDNLNEIINSKTNWIDFDDNEKSITENTVLLTSLLYNMGKVKLTIKTDESDEIPTVNHELIDKSISSADNLLHDI